MEEIKQINVSDYPTLNSIINGYWQKILANPELSEYLVSPEKEEVVQALNDPTFNWNHFNVSFQVNERIYLETEYTSWMIDPEIVQDKESLDYYNVYPDLNFSVRSYSFSGRPEIGEKYFALCQSVSALAKQFSLEFKPCVRFYKSNTDYLAELEHFKQKAEEYKHEMFLHQLTNWVENCSHRKGVRVHKKVYCGPITGFDVKPGTFKVLTKDRKQWDAEVYITSGNYLAVTLTRLV